MMTAETRVRSLFLKLYERGKSMTLADNLRNNALQDLSAIRYDLDRYQHIIDVVKSRKKDPDWGIQPLLDDTEILYVMKQLADARGTIAYYRKRNSDPSGRW